MHIFEAPSQRIELASEYHGDWFVKEMNGELVGLDYIAETDKTASNVFRCDHVGVGELIDALRRHQRAGEALNKFKKAMFRKQSREEADLPHAAFGVNNLPLDGLIAGMGHDDLFHGVIGVATESSELSEYLADCLEGKRRFDIENVREETGDVLWYLSRLVKWADTTFLSEMKRNIAKLRARHGPDGFDKGRDMNRDPAREADVLQKGNWDKPITEAIPDLHCPDCGADVDENCENLANCPRSGTGIYAEQGES